MNKIFSSLLLFFGVVGACCTTASAQTFEIDHTDDGVTAKICKIDVTGMAPGVVTIPSTIEKDGITYQITSIGAPDDGSTSAVFYAQEVADYTVDKIYNVTEVVIPEGVTSIGASVFYDLPSLAKVTIPESVTEIGDQAFNSTGLTSVTLPRKNPLKLGGQVFQDCNSLTEIYIPDNVYEMGTEVTNQCRALVKIRLPRNPNITVLTSSFFQECHSLECVYVPSNFTMVEEFCFSSCWVLKKLTLESPITRIGNSAFAGAALNEISVNWQTPLAGTYAKDNGEEVVNVPNVPDDAFLADGEYAPDDDDPFMAPAATTYSRTNTTLWVPAGTKSAYESVAPWNTFTIKEKEVDVPYTITAAGYGTFVSDQYLVVPTGLKAGYVKESGISGNMANVEWAFLDTDNADWIYRNNDHEVIKPNTPVILKGNPGTYNFEVAYAARQCPAEGEACLLTAGTGSGEVSASGGDKFYVLGYDKDNAASAVGFYFQYPYFGEAVKDIPTNRAYLRVPSTLVPSTKGFSLESLTLTSLPQLIAHPESKIDAPTYDLWGRRNSNARGIVIRDGKKFVRL